jgi:hypothetical protein
LGRLGFLLAAIPSSSLAGHKRLPFSLGRFEWQIDSKEFNMAIAFPLYEQAVTRAGRGSIA